MHSSKFQLYLADENKTKQLAIFMAELVKEDNLFSYGLMIYLKGDLGTGKSFFSRAFIQSFIPEQKVKSPTYTLIESYPVKKGMIQHFDLYRLADPEELEFLAIRDLLEDDFIALVEWPEKGEGVLPKADIVLNLTRSSDTARYLDLVAYSEIGLQTVEKLTKKLAHNLL